jgi:phosphoglycerate dehydrogenase-like enzyme
VNSGREADLPAARSYPQQPGPDGAGADGPAKLPAAGTPILVARDLADPGDRTRPTPFLRAALGRLTGCSIGVMGAEDRLDRAAREAEILILGAQPFGEAELATDRPSLRLLARHGAGFDTVDLDAMTRAGIMVTNTPRAVRRPVALMAITFALALAQSLISKDRLTREGRWQERGRHLGPGLTGKTLGIIGAGSVGLETARLAEAIGMKVVVARSRRNAVAVAEERLALADLDEVVEQSDFLVLTCRLSEETHHLIDRSRLGRMKPGAFLINVARGAVVDEAALIEALATGAIAGAGLDVFEKEPVDPANPLLRMENVVLAPHSLCVTEETLAAIAAEVAENVVAALAGQVPQDLVNPRVLDHPRVRGWLEKC